MDIFTKYDQKTWIKQVGYPAISLLDPENYETVYHGRDLRDYFNEFDIQYYKNHIVWMYLENGGILKMGTIDSILKKSDGKLPVIKIEFCLE